MDRRKISTLVIGIISLLLLTAADQLSKYIAVINLKNRASLTLIPNFFSLTYVENPGSAWGMFQNMQWLVVVLSFVIIVGVMLYFIRLPAGNKYLPLKAALIVLASGAAGNLIDRLTRGIVVDFFEFKFISFPVFNVADIYVTVSVAVLFILLVFVYKEDDLYTMKKENDERI